MIHMRRKSKKAPVPDRQILLSGLHPEQELFTADIQFVHGIAPFGFYFAGKDLVSFGFSIMTVDSAGNSIGGAYTIFFITILIMMAMMAMICRNIYLIFKTSEGKTSFSKGQTPFQPDNIRMVREIGIFLIAIPVVGLIMDIIAHIALGPEIECSMDLHFIIVGLVAICLSRFFTYGMELQEDVDGLV